MRRKGKKGNSTRGNGKQEEKSKGGGEAGDA